MSKFSTRINRFFLRHRNKGIPNLTLYICLGAATVNLLMFVPVIGNMYYLLCFDKAAILEGQVWRLFTWLFTENMGSNPFFSLIFLYFFYRLGRSVELSIGTLKFNLFYLGGVILMDVFAMLFCPTESFYTANFLTGEVYLVTPEYMLGIYNQMAFYLHLSLILAFASTNPDSRFMILMIIPVPAWVLSLIYLALSSLQVLSLSYPAFLFPHCLFPLVGLLNYFLFFYKDLPNILPPAWRRKFQRKPSGPKVINFDQGTASRPKPKKEDFRHKCTICGRTDISNPEMEFRYCSRCKGYHCYCSDHIGNHTHVD